MRECAGENLRSVNVIQSLRPNWLAMKTRASAASWSPAREPGDTNSQITLAPPAENAFRIFHSAVPAISARIVVTSRTLSPFKLPTGTEATSAVGMNNMAAARSGFLLKANFAARSAPVPCPITIMGNSASPEIEIASVKNPASFSSNAASLNLRWPSVARCSPFKSGTRSDAVGWTARQKAIDRAVFPPGPVNGNNTG